MSVILTVCETCKREGWDPEVEPSTDGERLATLVDAQLAGKDDVAVRRHACLMGCDFSCNLSLQSEGKLTYVLGMFEPSDEDAVGIAEFAEKYAKSETGQVPYREWPQAIKGHFRARIPPATSDK